MRKILTLVAFAAITSVFFTSHAFAHPPHASTGYSVSPYMYTDAWYSLITRTDPALPDLIVEDMYLDSDQRLTIRQRNRGMSDAKFTKNGETHVFIDGYLRYIYNWSELEDLSFLNEGESSEFKLVPFEGAHMIKVCVDHGNRGFGFVEESSRFNNCLLRRIDADNPGSPERRMGFSVPVDNPSNRSVRMPRYRRTIYPY